jgi:hypothetical protein
MPLLVFGDSQNSLVCFGLWFCSHSLSLSFSLLLSFSGHVHVCVCVLCENSLMSSLYFFLKNERFILAHSFRDLIQILSVSYEITYDQI